jgi:ribokinase
VRAGFDLAADLGAALVVNPAPPPSEDDADLLAAAVELPWQLVSLATPNEKEARLMLGAALGVQAVAHVESVALAELFATTFGVPVVCVTLSERGCVVHDAGGSRAYPAAAAQVVDTTAASDALTAAITVGLLAAGWRGGPAGTVSGEIVTSALEAAAWTVGRRGAYDALPTVADLNRRTVLDL